MLRIMISPAKKMHAADDLPVPATVPLFLDHTEALKQYLQELDYGTLKGIWKCNDAIAAQNVERLRDMCLTGRVTPAVMAYDGIQYQHMAPEVMTREQLSYIGRHLYILSGFYGVLHAFDGVVPYRLEMQAKLDWKHGAEHVTSLYDYWGDRLYRVLTEPEAEKTDPVTIVNLASKEYSKAVESWLKPDDSVITCVFGEEKDGAVKVKATAAKMARGSMVRYMAECQAENIDQLKGFDRMGYQYQECFSDIHTLVFTRKI